MNRVINYWQSPVLSTDRVKLRELDRTAELVLGALLAALTTVLQSAGGLLPGIGYLISPFATLPVAIAALLSLKMGVSTYIVAVGLLFLLQPAELLIYPFTTGLLGLAIGYALLKFRRRGPAMLMGGTALFAGIVFLLVVVQFPLFGPDTEVGSAVLGGLSLFSFLYAWIWTEIVLLVAIRLSFLSL